MEKSDHKFIVRLWVTGILWDLRVMHTHYCRDAGLLKEEMVIVQPIKIHTA